MTRRTGRRKTLWAAALFVPALLTLAACTVGNDKEDVPSPTGLTTPAPTSNFNDFTAFAEEYERAAERLAASLPAGVDFPTAPPGEWESDGTFEEGTGEVAAVLQWRCEWASVYVASSDTGEAADAISALERLAEWSELPEVVAHADGETRAKWIERVVEPTRGGDDATLRAIQAEVDPESRTGCWLVRLPG